MRGAQKRAHVTVTLDEYDTMFIELNKNIGDNDEGS